MHAMYFKKQIAIKHFMTITFIAPHFFVDANTKILKQTFSIVSYGWQKQPIIKPLKCQQKFHKVCLKIMFTHMS